MKVTIEVDPACLSTAQQTIVAFKARRIIKNPRVRRSQRIIRDAMIIHSRKVRRYLDEMMLVNPRAGISLREVFRFAFPSGGTKREKATRYESQPVISAKWGDCDNRAKGVDDALMQCHAIPDDHFITELLIRKVYTFGRPRIDFGFFLHSGNQDEPIFTPEPE